MIGDNHGIQLFWRRIRHDELGRMGRHIWIIIPAHCCRIGCAALSMDRKIMAGNTDKSKTKVTP